MEKHCKVCNKPLSTDDPRKQYCSNACKQEAHRQRHGIEKPVFLEKASSKPVESLKPIEIAQPKPVPTIDRVEADNRFVVVSQAIVELNSRLYKLQLRKEALQTKLAPLENNRSKVGDITEGITKGVEMGQQLAGVLGGKAAHQISVALGLFTGMQRARDTDHAAINNKNRLKARLVRNDLREVDEQINQLTASRIYLENNLNQLKREIKAQLVTVPTVVNHELPGVTQLATVTLSPSKQERGKIKVISLSELKAQVFDVYEFSSGFDEIIGNPSKNFSMIVYGESGQGKSTWVLDFANYLAENHGRVLYNSSEERISQSLKRKIVKYDSENFAISECRTYRALKQAITGNGFDFVVIDSINDMKIKPDEIEQLTELNADKAFIFIMQATKDGKYKGSSQFVHDADILIKLENYQPIIEKTRFR